MPGAVNNPALGPGGTGYGLAKKFIVQYTETLALQLAPQSIRVNAIHPTNCNTNLLHNDELYKIFRPDLEHPTADDVLPAHIHFNAILGWLAVGAMLVNVASGLTGKYLLSRSRRRLEEARQKMREQGLSPEQLADRTYWDSLTFDAVKQWRSVHFPITLAFAVLTLAHILAVFLFWGWR